MSAPKKDIEEKYQNIWVGFKPKVLADLKETGLKNRFERSVLIRMGVDFLLKNKKKFNLK